MSKDNKTGGPPATINPPRTRITPLCVARIATASANAAKFQRLCSRSASEGWRDWKPPALAPDQVYLYGLHTVRAALDNPERKIIKLSVTQNALVRLEVGPVEALGIPVEIVSPQDIDKVLGPDAIHQGVMLETRSPARPPPRSAERQPADPGARSGDRSAQCRRHHALGRRLQCRRRDHDAAPQPDRIRRAWPNRPPARWS
jgi:hypothetical protein